MRRNPAGIVIRVLAAVTVFGLVVAAVTYEPFLLPGVAASQGGATELEGGGVTGEIHLFVAEGAKADALALMILRAALGMMIFLHGYNRAFRGGRLAGSGRLQSIGMRPGKVHATVAALTEMGVGVLLVVGLITQLAAAGLIASMVAALWTMHPNKGLMITGEGREYVALIAAMSVVCAMLGPGAISVDAELQIGDRLDGWTGLWIALGVGVSAGAAQLLLMYRRLR